MGLLREYRPAAVALAPWLLALIVAAAGVMLLFSGATPSDPMRFLWLARYTPVIEISHFLSSILGLALVMMAFGLSRRLDAAWMASLLLLPLAAVLALLKGFNWEESAILMAVFLAMLPFHEALSSGMERTPGWMVYRRAGDGRGGDRWLVVVPADLPGRDLLTRAPTPASGALLLP